MKMKNFIKAMLKAKVAYTAPEMGMRIYNHLDTKAGYKLSVQASENHYCTPRELVGLKYYEEYEIAIMKNGDFIYPDELKSFPRKDELDECHEGTIFAYVPVDLVEDLYNFLNTQEDKCRSDRKSHFKRLTAYNKHSEKQ